jgi:hypothetical protein
MDGGGLNHYVATTAALAGERANGIDLLELLLFLSAMLAGLTGLISGDRAVDPRRIESSAVAAGALVELGTKTAEASIRVSAPSVPELRTRSAAPAPVLAALELPQAAPVDERRLE